MEATLVARDYRLFALAWFREGLVQPACLALAEHVDLRREGRPIVMTPLPTCVPGTGALSATHPGKVPVRVVWSYDRNTLMNLVTADILYEPIG
jgi:hypothetical protein